MIRHVRFALFCLMLLALVPTVTSARPNTAIATTIVRGGNLRAQPSTSATIVTGLTRGTAVSAASRSNGWARVTVTRSGARGWVIRSLLSMSDSQFAALPVDATQAPPAQPAPPVSAAQGTTVLLVGIDRRPGETSARADAIIVMRLNPQGGTVSLLSLPRDLLVNVPGYGTRKINAAYQFGGLALQKQAVSQFIGRRIDYAAAINFGGFEGLVNALGGVVINVPRRLIDPAYPTPDYGTVRVVFEPGVQVMNGARALVYSRTRHPDSDFGRMHRQQQVMSAIGERLRALGVGGTVARAGNIAAQMSNFVVTDMPLSVSGNVLYNAWSGIRAPRLYVVDQRYASCDAGCSNLIPNRPAIQRLVSAWAGQ